VRVIARRPDRIVGLRRDPHPRLDRDLWGAGTEIAEPRPGDQLTVDKETIKIQGEPERRAPDRLVWTLDVRPA
jgi:hypothetical protein